MEKFITLNHLKMAVQSLLLKINTEINTLSPVAKTGSYNDLTDKPTQQNIPTKISDLNDDIGVLTVETDPIFSASAAAGIQTNDITNWNNKLSSYTETDPTVPAWAKAANKPTYTASEVGALPDTTIIPTVPTTVSSFINDSDYQTSSEVQSAINTAIGNINSFEVEVVSSLPTSDIQDHTIYFVPQAVNSSAHDEYMYINNNWELIGTTTVDLSGYLQSSDIAAWAKAANKPSYTAQEVGALPSTYTAPVTSVNGQTGVVSLTIPTVPTNVSDFTNDAGYLTSFTETDPTVPAWAKTASKPTYTAAEVGAIATTHAAAAITSTDISNWNAKSNFSGSYTDLTDKPTIPAAVSVSNTLASGTLIATINGTNIYAPSYTNGDNLAYGGE